MKPDTAELPPALSALVVKDGVGLGGSPATQQALALALVWAGLPAAEVLSERQLNALLQGQLAGAAAFLATDHVELRRWLVDAGWLARDGYGREYRRLDPSTMTTVQRELAHALTGIDPAAWVGATRAAHQARRETRRRDWQAGRGAAS